MSYSDKKERLPKSDAKWEYPYNSVTCTLGGHEFHVNDTPDQETIRNFHTAGTFDETDKNGTKVSLVADQSFNYVNQGVTNTSEAGSDNFSEASRTQDRFGAHSESSGDVSRAVFGQNVDISKGSALFHTTGRCVRISTENSFCENNDANDHTNTEGDSITFMRGTKYQQIRGEYGVHLPEGNMDFQAESGKARIKTSQKITIDSDTEIEIVVGSSSITLKPGEIVIKSSAVKFEKA